MTITINLPTPPSVNRIWRVGAGGRVYIDPKYNAWRRFAGWELAAQRPGKLPHGQQLAVTIRLGRMKRTKDADNCAKAVLDLLEAHGVIRNDRDVAKLVIERDGAISTGRVLVEARVIKKKDQAA
jgi:Holliday junction resolvase RusA-like endonuclease